MAGINGSMAHLSDALFTTAIAIYALAMVGYTAEYAFGRRRPQARPPPRPARELVGAGGPPVDRRRRAADVPDAVAATRVRPTGSAAGRSSSRSSARCCTPPRSRCAAIAVDAVPWSNMYEFASVAGLSAWSRSSACCGRLPAAAPPRRVRPAAGRPADVPGRHGAVLPGPAARAGAAVVLAGHPRHAGVDRRGRADDQRGADRAVPGARPRHDRRVAAARLPSRARSATLAAKLPAAATLDKAAYRVVAFAFPLYTVAIICGAIWAEAAWGRYWGWDPKETWAFIVWVIYACYLHARATAGWKGRAAPGSTWSASARSRSTSSS